MKALLSFLVILSGCLVVNAQRDTTFIKKFRHNNVLEFYPGIYETRFRFTKPRDRNNNFTLAANSSAYAGFYLNYKWLSVKYSFALPGTQLDRKVQLGLASLRFRVTARNMVFHPFYDNYDGLLIPKGPNSGYDPFKSIRFIDAGLDFYYYFNANRFSFRAANAFSEKQVQSAGAPFLMISSAWNRVNWRSPSRSFIPDSVTYNLLARSPQWVYLVGRGGYAYNFVFDNGDWLVAPYFLFGLGGVKQVNNPRTGLRLVTGIQAGVNVGYNGDRHYVYLSATADNLSADLLTKNMSAINNGIQLTYGHRFGNYRKKILGVL